MATPDCYLCGGPDADTNDHVFPKSLFPKPRPTLLTAPACRNCNQSLSLDEEYFRAFVLASTYPHPQAKKLWIGPLRRSLTRTPKFKQMLASQLRSYEAHTSDGRHLGRVDAFFGETNRIDRVLEKMVRGLYLRHVGDAISRDVVFQHSQVTLSNCDRVPWDLIDPMPTIPVGDCVVYRFGIAEDDPRHSMWVLLFYERSCFIVTTSARTSS